MLTQLDIEKIVKFVQKEPRTINDIAMHINRSWVTTESYVKQIQTQTGRVIMKVFRPNTQGALKIVFIPSQDSLIIDEVKQDLLNQIKTARRKEEFDILEIFQYLDNSKKNVEVIEKNDSGKYLLDTQSQLLILSGNLSFVTSQLSVIERLLERKVTIRIVCRINLATLTNLRKIQTLVGKYPGQIEIRNRYQPLRGFIRDGTFARFIAEEKMINYRPGELHKDMIIAYTMTDSEWVQWMEQMFWSMYRTSGDMNSRIKELKKIK